MITYRKGCNGIPLLFRFVGTAWPAGIVPGLVSACIGTVLGQVHDVDVVVSDPTKFMDNHYPFQLFAYLVGFVMVFRTNFAYQRYWEALDAVLRMGSKWLDGACMAVAFDAPGDMENPYLVGNRHRLERPEESKPGPLHDAFFIEIVHLFSLLHALALLHLRCDPDLTNLEHMDEYRMTQHSPPPPASVLSPKNGVGGIAHFNESTVAKQNQVRKIRILGKLLHEERLVLDRNSQGVPVPTVARVSMALSWVMRRLIARQKYEPIGDMCKTSPPILSRLYQVLSDGHLAFSQAAKVADTPFPFPYHNLIRVLLWMYAFSVPFVINAKVLHHVARFIINFMAVWAYFALCEVGDNLEDPFLPYDPNELPLQAIQHSFNSQLLSLCVVPGTGLESADSFIEPPENEVVMTGPGLPTTHNL